MIAKLKQALRARVSKRQINALHKGRAIYHALKNGLPASDLLVIGITGTKGKTTACHFLTSILEEAGYKVGMATTVDFQIGSKKWLNETNKSVVPPAQLQALLKEMKQAHCNVVVLEVTSHAIDQSRIWGIPFSYVGFTNLSHDHLDYHGTMEQYRDTKLRLFKLPKTKAAVINLDDVAGQYILDHSSVKRKMSFSTEIESQPTQATDHIFASQISATSSSASFFLEAEGQSEKVVLQLPGRFNIENALVASGLALCLNIKPATIAAGLSKLDRVPGRMEKLETKKGFTVIIDYAHTPDSLEKLYSTLRPDVRGRMIAILGACGNRDRTKRPIMGALAARFCDQIILTDEEPYDEDSQDIIDEIAKGVPRGRTLFKPSRDQIIKAQNELKPVFKKEVDENGENDWWWRIPDRKQAIKLAIERGKMDDCILITGMGAQTYKIVKGQKVPWNDRTIVEEILLDLKLINE